MTKTTQTRIQVVVALGDNGEAIVTSGGFNLNELALALQGAKLDAEVTHNAEVSVAATVRETARALRAAGYKVEVIS